MPQRDYYKVLNVPRNATSDQIKRAYRKLAKQYHPDRNPNDKSAEAKFKEVQEAYDVLNEPEKRRMYDQFGHAAGGVGAGGPSGWRPGPGGAGGPRVYTWRGGPGGGSEIPIDMEDLFSTFSGAGAAQENGGASIFDFFTRNRRGGRRAEAEPAGDVEQSLSLSFEDAIRGTTLEMRVSVPGQPVPETVRVRIPAGVADGQRIRVRGKGTPNIRGTRGDLYFVCHVSPHRYFRRSGNDIYIDLPLTLSEAALGAKVEIPTLDGRTVLTIPSGTPSGAQLRLKGKGVKPAGSTTAGDQYAVIRIVPPKSPTIRQRELLEQLRAAGEESPRTNLGW